MKKRTTAGLGWLILLIALIAINIFATAMHFRLDLTAEKRFTLSEPTTRLLDDLSEPVTVTVFLSGEMPAGFRRLSESVEDLLQEFKEKGAGSIQYVFRKPGDGLDEEAKNTLLDSLSRMGIRPYNVQAQTREGEGSEERLLFPGALIAYRDRAIGVDLLAGQSSLLDENSINRSEALLEYKFAHAIHQVTQDTVPLIGYLTGNGQPLSLNVYDLIESTLKPNYPFRLFPIDSFPVIPQVFSAMLIVKPTQPFSDEQKLKIDQYIMHGGKVLWMIDNLYAEYDSLLRSKNDFIAFDRNLNLQDLLFKYGVRVNLDLVQSLNADKLPSVVGTMGGRPQIELIPWPYFPLLGNESGHPIAKNLDYVVAQFPQSIDTVKAAGIRKTILLSTSDESRIISSPARVQWQSIRNEGDLQSFNQGNLPVAVLLEGRFSSLYANRLSSAAKDSLAYHNASFLPAAVTENSMIVVSDGDIALNAVTQNDGPLAMGTNSYSKFQYANKAFILNCLEFLTDASGILETRGKDYSLRLFDKSRLESERSMWQLLNLVLPVALILLAGVIFQLVRKRRFEGSLKSKETI